MSVSPEKIEPICSLALAYYKYPDDKHKELKDVTNAVIKNPEVAPIPNNTMGLPFCKSQLNHYYQRPGENLLYDNDHPIYQHFHDWLKDCYISFTEDIMGYNIPNNKAFITDCWVNKTEKDGRQYPHDHVNSFVSGTYYLHMEEGSGKILFTNPNMLKNTPYIGFDNLRETDYNKEVFEGDCKEQYLILWLSHLSHQTTDTIDGTRLSISMNFMPEEFISGPYSFKVVKSQL